eukprot:18700-Eustigmatos_ZCMA.PRE.1
MRLPLNTRHRAPPSQAPEDLQGNTGEVHCSMRTPLPAELHCVSHGLRSRSVAVTMFQEHS